MPVRLPFLPRCPTKNLGPIGSAVLTFIGYKQTNKQTDKHQDRQAKFIYRFRNSLSTVNVSYILRVNTSLKFKYLTFNLNFKF